MPRRGGINPLFYYGVIESAARAGQSTAQIWQAIRGAAEAAGLPSPGINAAQVSTIRGKVGGVLTAERNLSALAPQMRIRGEHIGVAGYARDAGARAALPIFNVRFAHTTIDGGQITTTWRTVVFEGSLPRTKRDLLTAVESDAQQMAEDYGVEHAGIDEVSITAV